MSRSDMSILFVSGMFRSGTTLLGRMLNAHPQVTVASDPYLPFFKMFRTQKAGDLGMESAVEFPLSDYYFSSAQIGLFQTIQKSSLDVPFDSDNLTSLHKQIRSYGEPFAPLIMPHLDRIRGNTYTNLFCSMMNLLEKEYAKGGERVIGFKEVWADEFIPCIARSFPKAKFIQILRDPRAVCASKNMRPSRYPWLFMARQWRKLAALAWKYQRGDDQLKGRVLLIQYEDLVRDPQESSHSICDFLEIECVEEMVDPRTYVDGSGASWMQNTAFGNGGQEFDTGAIERWRDVLSKREVALIESLCAPEMGVHRYQLQSLHLELTGSLLLSAPFVADGDLARWIRRFVANDSLNNAVEMAKEKLRYVLLEASPEDLASVDPIVIEGCFLFRELFEHVSKIASRLGIGRNG